MSFYWQQSLPQQDTGQPGQKQPQQQGHWDFINLSGAPTQPQQHQWNAAGAQQHQNQNQNYYYSQSAQQHSAQQPQPQHNVPVQHHQQPAVQQWVQQQTAQVQHQPQLPKAQTTAIEHTPLLPPVQPQQQQQQQQQQAQQQSVPQQQQNFVPVPPVLATSQTQHHQQQQQVDPQYQQYYQQQLQQHYVGPKEVSPPPQAQVQPAPTVPLQSVPVMQAPPLAQPPVSAPVPPAPQQSFPPPPVTQFGSAPSSKEVTPEPQQQQQRVAPQPQPPVTPAPIPTPPVLAPTPSAQPPATKSAKKMEHSALTVADVPPVVVAQPQTKITPTSSEDDWEKADMEVQQVDDENKRAPEATITEKPEESRESSSLGGSWSQQDTEPSERSSAEPVEIVEHPVESAEEKTPRVSMSENTQTPVNLSVHEDRQETPDVRQEPQNSSTFSSSPGVAQATSTPKDAIKLEKRASISSQGTINAEREKKSDEDSKKPEHRTVVENENSGNNSDSTMASGRPEFERGHARASYREYKKTYLEICDRLKIMRTDTHHSDFRPSSKLGNPLLAAAGLSRHPAIRRESTGGRNDGRASVPLHHSQSFTENPYHGQNGGRRSRVSRLDPNARPSSRQAAGYQSANLHYDPRMMNPYDQQVYFQQQQAGYRQGRYSAMGAPYAGYGQAYDPRRPPSSYMMDPYTGYGQEPQETSSLSESEEEDENAESDDELRRYNMQQQQQQQRAYGGAQPHQLQQPAEEDVLYYCGIVHVNREAWRRIKDKYPIPEAFYTLKPIEKAAFMFYSVLFKQPYQNVKRFHERFNLEFFKFVCAGNSNDEALYKICQSMQQQYIERQKQKEAANLSARGNMFSDDTSIDGQSEMNSVYEESLSGYDIANNGPLKFSCPHSFMHISTGGRVISIQPDQSISVVVFDDIKSMLKDLPTLQVKDAAQSFKGPLIPNQSAPHTVRLYISKQIENIRRSAVAEENPHANDVVESLLVWQLLETMVKQQGNITGPDIADLLAKVASEPVNIEAPPQQSNVTPALNEFTKFLLGGHIDEAVNSAIRNGLFADALVLTRRLFPNDERRIEQIENRFLETRSLNNPVTTLVTVAKGEAPPVLTNPPMDDHLSWRTHAAIILANLGQRGTAMNTIYQLGRALAKKDYHCAADFCFMVYCVLGGNNPFEPIPTPEGEEEYRRHISLVNSDIPDNETNPKCQYGFLITDLHATEIFDYALRLKPDRESPLSRSVEYQTSRIKYAKLLANHGYTTDAYRYCTEIARAIWFHVAIFDSADLLELCDLAESLHIAASVDLSETQWIHDLRASVNAGLSQQVQPAVIMKQEESEVAPQSNEYYQNSGHEGSVEKYNPTPVATIAEEPITIPKVEQQNVAYTLAETQLPDPEAVSQHYSQEEVGQVPPTPPEPAHHETVVPKYETPYNYPVQHSNAYGDDEGFTTPPDFNDAPLTMASSPPLVPPEPQPQNAPSSLPTPQATPNHAPLVQNAPPQAASQPIPDARSNGWLKSIQSKVQQVIPGQNPMRLPDDTNPAIVWDPVQEKYVGDGVEQEEVAPPPPTMPAAPPVAVQGGGLRAARGAASRYANVGLGGSSPNAPQVPTGMLPPAPPSFGFMPAPVDDDSEYVDPFSGQANPTIQQSAPMPSDD